jgi:hypothetical protein
VETLTTLQKAYQMSAKALSFCLSSNPLSLCSPSHANTPTYILRVFCNAGMIASNLQLHRYGTGRESRVVTAMTLLKSHLFK